MKNPLSPQRKSGFTLIELLVVIAIIALLAALLIPVANRAMASGRSAKCVGNLKQLGVAMQNYLNDFNNTLPYSASTVGFIGELTPNFPRPANHPNRWLNPYLLDKPFAEIAPGEKVPAGISPMDPKKVPVSTYLSSGSSYMINCATAPDGVTRGLRRANNITQGYNMLLVENRSKVILFATGNAFNFWQGGDRGQRWFPGDDDKKVSANACFVDGHVSTITIHRNPPSEPLDYTWSPGNNP